MSVDLSSQEKREIGTKIFLDKGLHKILIKFDKVISFKSWETDPDSIYNFGLTEISTKTVKDEFDIDRTKHLGTSKFHGTEFTFGFYRKSTGFPDGTYFDTKNLVFYLGNKLVIDVSYTDDREVDYLPEKLKYSSLNEFHYSQELEDLIYFMNDSIKKQDLIVKEFNDKNKFDPDEDKFSF